jgi:hypothetical protein
MNEQFKTLDKHGGITIGQELKIVKIGKNVGRFIKMNERIKALVEQALKHPDNDDDGLTVFDNDELEKFVESIVRECMRMCDVAAVGYETHGYMKEANGCASAREYIEEHFGVES